MRTTCSAHLKFEFVAPVIFSGEYKLWSSPLCHFLHPPVSIQVFFWAPCSQTPRIYIFLFEWETKFHTHTKNSRPFVTFCYMLVFLDSSASLVTGCTGWTTGLVFPTGTENFSLRHRVQTSSGAYPASFSVGTGGFFPWS
jgi:hypothetical protein